MFTRTCAVNPLHVCPRTECEVDCVLKRPSYMGLALYPSPSPLMGCICPPTSEQTCQNPVCPRKDNSPTAIRAMIKD